MSGMTQSTIMRSGFTRDAVSSAWIPLITTSTVCPSSCKVSWQSVSRSGSSFTIRIRAMLN